MPSTPSSKATTTLDPVPTYPLQNSIYWYMAFAGSFMNSESPPIPLSSTRTLLHSCMHCTRAQCIFFLKETQCIFSLSVAKMASHAILQYNVLAINDTHNTWTNMIVKINIPRLLGSSDDKEKIGAARPEGTKLFGPRDKDWGILLSPVKPT